MIADHALDHVRRTRIIAILRGDLHGRAIEITDALVRGGVTAIEVSAVSPHFAQIIRELVAHHGSRAAIGAGTVLSLSELEAAYAAGASFIVSPNIDIDIVDRTRSAGLASFPGGYTVTEIVVAHRAGAHAVKLFPAVSLGPSYVRALRAPLPNIPLVPTGGVTLENASDFIEAGAFALGIGSELVGQPELQRLDAAALEQKARNFVQSTLRHVHA